MPSSEMGKHQLIWLVGGALLGWFGSQFVAPMPDWIWIGVVTIALTCLYAGWRWWMEDGWEKEYRREFEDHLQQFYNTIDDAWTTPGSGRPLGQISDNAEFALKFSDVHTADGTDLLVFANAVYVPTARDGAERRTSSTIPDEDFEEFHWDHRKPIAQYLATAAEKGHGFWFFKKWVRKRATRHRGTAALVTYLAMSLEASIRGDPDGDISATRFQWIAEVFDDG